MTNAQTIDYRLISLLTAEQAHTFQAVPYERQGNRLILLGHAGSRKFLPQLRMLLNEPLELKETSPEQCQKLLLTHYPQAAPASKGVPPPAEGATQAMVASSDVVRLVEEMFRDAVAMRASDIHIERYEEMARVRFRWEGQLVERFEIPLAQYNAVVSRIKILAELDIAERRLPQDGRIQLPNEGKPLDLRVSTVPSKYGEKVVMRLLTREQAQLDLSNLGLGGGELAAYQQAIAAPNGIILITGPTGSGKTTTLYATLSQLNQPQVNILTVEDPIEYNLSGINQVQVKPEIELTFERALRAFLRQDPDIIMVGEVRDTPTAQIAIRASLTGHLVFSTLHTNTAWDAISRLSDMGVEPYLLAAALRLIVAQRLVRQLCPHCKRQAVAKPSPFVEAHQIETYWEPVGCPQCYYTGYKGRKAVFEILPVDRSLARAIKDISLHAQAPPSSFPTLSENVADMVKRGETSLAEALLHAQ